MLKAEANWAEFTKKVKQRGQVKLLHKVLILAFLQSFNQHSKSSDAPLPLFQILSSQQLSSRSGDRKLFSTIKKLPAKETTKKPKQKPNKQTKSWHLSSSIQPILGQTNPSLFLFLPCREHHFRTEYFLLKQNKRKQGVYLGTRDVPGQDRQNFLYLSKYYLTPYNPNSRIKVGAANKDLNRGNFLSVRVELLCQICRAIEG